MNTIARPGICEKWNSRQWRGIANSAAVYGTTFNPIDGSRKNDIIIELEYYLAHGEAKWVTEKKLKAHLQPYEKSMIEPEELAAGQQIWRPLSFYTFWCLGLWEAKGVDKKIWDADLVNAAFFANYLMQMINLYRYESIRPQSMNDFIFTALGFVIGHYEQASRLARLRLAAYRKYDYDSDDYAFTGYLIMRILADYLGEPPLPAKGVVGRDPERLMKGEVLVAPVFDSLFKEWRNQDVDVLLPHCLAACDIHTYMSWSGGTRSPMRDFNNGSWTRTPIAILLILRLRSLLGLNNPKIDHPLMNTAIGELPPDDLPYKQDELLERVLARIKLDGFDEQKIWAVYFG